MIKLLGGASLLAMSLMTAAIASEHDDDSVTLYRVFVGDHDAARVTAFDLSAPKKHWTFKTAGQVKLYSVADNSVIVAVQSDDNQVNFIKSGINSHDHGGHTDIEIEDPKAIKKVVKGPRPFHVIDHNNLVSINFDQGGYADVFDSHELSEGHIEDTRVPQKLAHHGVIVPWGDNWLSSIPADNAEEGKAPPRIGLQDVNTKGAPIGDLQTCTGLHGEAFSGVYLAVGCKEGVLTAKESKNGTQYEMLPYPSSFPKGEMSGTLLGAKSFQVFLASYGYQNMAIIDPTESPYMRLVELPFRRIDFILDPVKIQNGYVLTENGQIHRINLLSGEIEDSVQVIQPYSMDGHWNDPRPRLAMAGDEIIMTDPNAGLVRRISTKDFSEVGTIKVKGVPYNITVAGGSGVNH
jgi:zinc transport system substrate-binding protein